MAEPKGSAEVREQVKILYVQGNPPAQIAKRFPESGLKPNTISHMAQRGGWARLRDSLGKDCSDAVLVNISQQIERLSNTARVALARQIVAATDTLNSDPIKNTAELRNTPNRQGRAAVLKHLADTGAAVFQWDTKRIAL